MLIRHMKSVFSSGRFSDWLSVDNEGCHDSSQKDGEL